MLSGRSCEIAIRTGISRRVLLNWSLYRRRFGASSIPETWLEVSMVFGTNSGNISPHLPHLSIHLVQMLIPLIARESPLDYSMSTPGFAIAPLVMTVMPDNGRLSSKKMRTGGRDQPLQTHPQSMAGNTRDFRLVPASLCPPVRCCRKASGGLKGNVGECRCIHGIKGWVRGVPQISISDKLWVTMCAL
jgi:hypothetical protein